LRKPGPCLTADGPTPAAARSAAGGGGTTARGAAADDEDGEYGDEEEDEEGEGEEEEEEEEEEEDDLVVAQDWAALRALPERAAVLDALARVAEASGGRQLTVLLLGKSGVGKSSLVNALLGEKAAAVSAFKLQADTESTVKFVRQVGPRAQRGGPPGGAAAPRPAFPAAQRAGRRWGAPARPRPCCSSAEGPSHCRRPRPPPDPPPSAALRAPAGVPRRRRPRRLPPHPH
jgi:hypothetical protein